jgi:putative flippase GtrA
VPGSPRHGFRSPGEGSWIRFAIVGALGFLVDASALTLALFLGADFFGGRVVSFLCAVTATWYANRTFTFSSKDPRLLREWFRFLSANAVGGLANYSIYAVLVSTIPLCEAHPTLAVAAGSIAGLAINFTLSRQFVFATSGTHELMSAKVVVRALLLLAPVAAGLYALYLGQDASWDLRNYHYYNPFAFHTGRMGYDIAVAHVATYYNPALHLPFYWAVNSLPPWAVGFLLALLAGLNVWPLYLIARQAIDFERPTLTMVLCGATALVGMLGAMNLAELGTSYGDNLLSLPVLVSIWLALRFRERIAGDLRTGWPVPVSAGLLSGAALGFKLPFAIYAVALCAAFFALRMPFRRRVLTAFVFGIGVLAGAALTGGYWFFEMWQRFENPLFPYWNEYFQSPWASIGSYRDERFIPKDPVTWLLFPFWISVDPFRVGEVAFRDLRFALLYALLLVLPIKLGVSRLMQRPSPAASDRPAAVRMPAAPFLAVFILVAFVAWMKLFAVDRYLMVVEMLAPLAVLLVLGTLLRNERRLLRTAMAAFVVLVATVQPGDWGRRPWGKDYFGVEPPAISHPDRTIVLMAGYEPTAYMIPFFPRQVRFLRVQGYFTGPSPVPNETDRLMQNIVAGHHGPVFMLYSSAEEWRAIEAAHAYGLQLDTSTCTAMVSEVESESDHELRFCRCQRTLSSFSVGGSD